MKQYKIIPGIFKGYTHSKMYNYILVSTGKPSQNREYFGIMNYLVSFFPMNTVGGFGSFAILTSSWKLPTKITTDEKIQNTH